MPNSSSNEGDPDKLSDSVPRSRDEIPCSSKDTADTLTSQSDPSPVIGGGSINISGGSVYGPVINRVLGNVVTNYYTMPSTPVPYHIPFAPSPLFMGRDEELELLRSLLIPDGIVIPIPTITGMAGVGKTHLAAEFCHRFKQFFVGGVFWLNMGQPDGIADQVAAYAGPAGLQIDGWESMDFDDRVTAVRAAWQQPIIRLIVMDNLDEPALFRQWRPTATECRILITSRHAKLTALSGVILCPLGVLPRQAALKLLLSLRHIDVYDQYMSSNSANDICSLLGDLPLALTLAAAYLASYPGITLNDYQQQLELSLASHPSLAVLPEEGLPTNYPASIAATFALSYEQLRLDDSVDALALDLLHKASVCAPTSIPYQLLIRATHQHLENKEPDAPIDLALERLLAMGLLEQSSHVAVRMHRLLAAFTCARTIDSAGDLKAISQVLLEEITTINERDLPLEGEPYLEHVRHVLAVFELVDPINAAVLMDEFGVLLTNRGDYVSAQLIYDRALAIREQLFPPDHVTTAQSLNQLGWLLYRKGEYEKAKVLYERALDIRERVLGQDHPDTARSLNNLAWLYYQQGKYGRAKVLHQRALAIRGRVLGPNHTDTARSLEGLGTVLEEEGDLLTALAMHYGALSIDESELGERHPEVGTSLANIAKLLVLTNQYDAAKAIYERALSIFEHSYGPDHVEVGVCLHEFANLFMEQEEYTQAQSFYIRALQIFEHTLGSFHIFTATCLHSLAMLLERLGLNDDAVSYYERAVATMVKIAPEHPDTARFRQNQRALLHRLRTIL